MGRSLRIEYPGAFYHVTSRGNERKEVFKSNKDREQFLSYLESAVVRYGAVIHAYCLMSNHYHLLLETPSANLSKIMQHINGAYTNYFNAKRKRVGHLFQGRFKAIVIEADTYLLNLSRYIHLNPVRAKIVISPDEYAWSSYLNYIGTRKCPDWLTTDFVLERLGVVAGSYREFTEEHVGIPPENPFTNVVASTVLGSNCFVAKLVEEYGGGKQNDRELPAVRDLVKRPELDLILTVVKESEISITMQKNVSIYLCHHYSGATLKLIGERFGIKESAVSQASRRFSNILKRDTYLQKLVESVKQKLRL